MGTIQIQIVEFVTGPSNTAYYQYIEPPSDDEKWMCTNQIVQRQDYASFNVLGLSIIIGVGGLIIVLNMLKTLCGRRIQEHSVRGRQRNLEWRLDSAMHLQRLAYQNAGLIDEWKGLDAPVPVPVKAQKHGLPLLPETWRKPVPVSPTDTLVTDFSSAGKATTSEVTKERDATPEGVSPVSA